MQWKVVPLLPAKAWTVVGERDLLAVLSLPLPSVHPSPGPIPSLRGGVSRQPEREEEDILTSIGLLPFTTNSLEVPEVPTEAAWSQGGPPWRKNSPVTFYNFLPLTSCPFIYPIAFHGWESSPGRPPSSTRHFVPENALGPQETHPPLAG